MISLYRPESMLEAVLVLVISMFILTMLYTYATKEKMAETGVSVVETTEEVTYQN